MTREQFIERTLRQIYNGPVSDDATITKGLVNNYLSDGIGLAAKSNYKDNIALEGVSFINNSFYTTFKGLAVTKDEQALWKIELPQIPFGLGANDGVSTLKFKSDTNEISYPVVWLTTNQLSYQRGMREIPNKLLAYSEGKYLYVITPLILSPYTASVTMVSGGDSTDLSSELNVPADYVPIIVEYIKQQLLLEKAQPVDATNDGLDATMTT